MDSEIAPPQVFHDRGSSNLRRPSRLGIGFSPRHINADAHAARIRYIEFAVVFVGILDGGAALFQVFLQLEGVTLDRQINIANGKSAYDVADCSSGEENVHLASAAS